MITDSRNAVVDNIHLILYKYFDISMQLAPGLMAAQQAGCLAIAAQSAVVSQGLIFGLSTGACLGIFAGIAIVGCVGYLIYRYYNNKSSQSQVPVERHNSIPVEQLKIQRLKSFSPKQIESASSISTSECTKLTELYQCPITMQIMRKPYAIRCQCPDGKNCFEKQSIRESLKNDSRCPNCRTPVKFEEGMDDKKSEKAIQYFLKKVQKKGQEWVRQRCEQDFWSLVDPVVDPENN